MKSRLLSLILLLVCILSVGTARAAAHPESHRVITWFANWDGESLPNSLNLLYLANVKPPPKSYIGPGYATHIVVGLFHLAWQDEQLHTGHTISLGNIHVGDPKLDPVWLALGNIRRVNPKVKVLASFGGPTGDFRQLLDSEQFWNWYPPLRDMLIKYKFDGLDLDIEEGRLPNETDVNTENVRKLVQQLRTDFGRRFLITSAPVATDLVSPRDPLESVSPRVDYIALIKEPGLFDWYHVQTYGWRGLEAYDTIITSNNGSIPANKLVAGITTYIKEDPQNPDSPEYPSLSRNLPQIRDFAQRYPDFGGVFGWTFERAQVDKTVGAATVMEKDAVGWLKAVSEAVNPKK